MQSAAVTEDTSTAELLAALRQAKIPHLLIGGFAVNYHGYARTTFDMDFMIAAEDVPALLRLARCLGFQNLSEQDNVLFLRHSTPSLRLDFLKTDRQTLARMLDRAEAPTGDLFPASVVCLEDLIATKLFALRHAPARRRAKDLQDIIWLAAIHELNPDAGLRDLCARFGTPALLQEIREGLEALQQEDEG